MRIVQTLVSFVLRLLATRLGIHHLGPVVGHAVLPVLKLRK